MTSTAVQAVSQEDIKQAILALIRENNAEFKQLLGDFLPKSKPIVAKKTTKKQVIQEELPVAKVRVPYSEMPFWKANPDLKPLIPEGKGISMEAIRELQAFFQESGNEITDEMLEMLD
jgi:hypothetical protein